MKHRSLHILALVTDAFGGFGGIAQYNRDFLTALAGAESVNRIVVLPRHGDAQDAFVPPKILQLPAVPNKLAFAVKALSRLRQIRRIDVIFCGHIFMMPIAVPLARLTKASLWLQIHGIDAWQKPSRLLHWAAEQADQVTAVSRHTRRRFLSWANIAPEKVHVLPNTIDDKFSPGPKSLALSERYGLAGKKVLLTVSRLAAAERYKGHDRVIKALPEVLEIVPDAVYLIAGDGDDRPRLEQLARDKGIADKVIFAGRIAENELVDHFRLANLFVMPSTGEGFGIVFLQAAACCVMPIGLSEGGAPDALGDGALGIITTPNTLAADLCNLLQVPQSHAASLPEDVFRRFGRTAFTEHMQTLINRLAASLSRTDLAKDVE